MEWNAEGIARRFGLCMPGVYQADDDIYSRGWEKRALGDSGVFGLLDQFRQGEANIPYRMRRFVGMSLALMGGRWRGEWRSFAELDRKLSNPGLSGTTKRLPTGEFEKWNELPNFRSDGGISARYNDRTITKDPTDLEDRALEETNDEA